MYIVKRLNQMRRDFTSEIKCEGCGHCSILRRGYDDRNYHDNVMPNMKCEKCGKSRNDLGVPGDFIQTKYDEHQVV